MLYILLPAYNEAACLPSLLQAISEICSINHFDYKIVVCNDGSTDGSQAILENSKQQYPLEVLSHKRNRGLGETIRDLFEYVADICNDEDLIVRMDCDATHKASYILDLISKISEGYDLVSTSRFQLGGGQQGVNLYRRFISRAANSFMKIVFPIAGIRDYSCGFRAYRAGIVKRAIRTFGGNFIQLRGLGFTCTVEKLIKFKLIGARCAEVPFVLRYDLKGGTSKMVTSITSLGYIVLAIAYHWPWGGWRFAYSYEVKGKSVQ